MPNDQILVRLRTAERGCRQQCICRSDQPPCAACLCGVAADEIDRLRAIIARAKPLVALVTVRMAIDAGDKAIAAAGLNPWCLNEGRSSGDEKIGTWWMEVSGDG